jgi:uncharacterized protein (DUF305 family)
VKIGPAKTAVILLAAIAVTSCRSAHDAPPPIVQPGAPGQAGRVLTASAAASLPQPKFSAADVRFMQGMIGHHAQAVEMTGLLRTRTACDEMRMLGQRIEVSQADEIKMMQQWLQDRGQELPGPHVHHAPGAGLMPGMLTTEEMSRLAAAKGAEFDRLFLELMIKHHEGALTMVKDLFSQPGAGQEAEIFAFASDVEADQRMEIARMAAMLKKSKERQK